MVGEIAAFLILLAGLYLVCLAAVAVIAPRSAERFLTRLGNTPFAHFAELSLRLIVGLALVRYAPNMLLSKVFSTFGWVIIVTTVAMLLLPWRWHQRFAKWSVPQATRHLTWFAIGSLLGGLGIVIAVLFGR
jgi:hypothetical protein